MKRFSRNNATTATQRIQKARNKIYILSEICVFCKIYILSCISPSASTSPPPPRDVILTKALPLYLARILAARRNNILHKLRNKSSRRSYHVSYSLITTTHNAHTQRAKINRRSLQIPSNIFRIKARARAIPRFTFSFSDWISLQFRDFRRRLVATCWICRDVPAIAGQGK